MTQNDNHRGKQASVVRSIFLASIGNALEWFDFATYGFFALTIAKVFFPTGNGFSSLMLALASFGVPFFIRPVGAIVIGRYADRAGRKPAMTLTISMMLVGTLIIAVTPSYNSIGLLAPILVVAARFIQGFSAGGEFGSSITFLVEQDPSRRGYFGAWQFAGQGFSATCSAAAVWLISVAFTPDQIQAWAWRIPFFLGLLIGPIGLWMRASISETEEFTRSVAMKTEVAPLTSNAGGVISGALICAGLVAAGSASAYIMMLYMPTFAIKQFGMPASMAYVVAAIVGVANLVVIPVAGALSDRIGSRRVMNFGLVLAAAAIVPAFNFLVTQRTVGALLVCQAVMAVAVAIYMGGLPRLMSETFPPQQRSFGISLGYNLAATLFGGFSPVIVATLVHTLKAEMAPCWYVLAAIAVTIAAVAMAGRRTETAQERTLQHADL
ncbi:MFS transporter [Paraburkholderia flagellata]|uniref:MFS transporter n=1 Tax=Paraburkholderia flagellata TaxID=2883241 RepID=UPI001F3E10CB|nr:MFS transporter [Paraburkholderia flagellata]